KPCSSSPLPGFQGQADYQVAEQQRHRNGKETPRGNPEVGGQFAEDLARPIEMLAADEPLIRLVVAFLKDPLRRDAPGQAVCQAAFAGDDDHELAFLLVADAMQFAQRCREVWKMFQDVNRENAIEVT